MHLPSARHNTPPARSRPTALRRPTPSWRLALLGSLNVALLTAALPTGAAPGSEPSPRLVDVRKIWDHAPHNAFTDLIRFEGSWLCVFREGKAHVSPDGAIRVLQSLDGTHWVSAARLSSPTADLRDAKISRRPDGRLLLVAAGALHPPSEVKHRSMVWTSPDGQTWDGPTIVADPNQWLWRITWHQGRAYGVGYDTAGERFVRLYSSPNGTHFSALVPNLFDQQYPNESALVFLPDQRALCLLRRDGTPGHGLLGTARPPYTQWTWQDVGMKIGGPALIQLPDGRLVAGARLYNGRVRTSLLWIDPKTGGATEFLGLPSGGDTSYPGLVWEPAREAVDGAWAKGATVLAGRARVAGGGAGAGSGRLWVSYYSSHEGRTSIYLARVDFGSGTP